MIPHLRFALLLGCAAAPIQPVAAQYSLTTLFASNGGGSTGGLVFFDIAASSPVRITRLDTNFLAAAGTPVGLAVYLAPGTYAGKELNPGAWTRVAVDSGGARAAGRDQPTPIALTAPFSLAPGSYGVALAAFGSGHAYTNGNGSNQHYADGNLALQLGASQNTPWGHRPFTPRVWNGTLYYALACSGSATSAGGGCPDAGATVNTLSLSGCPDIGLRARLELHASASSRGAAFLACGLDEQSWNGVALPLDLAPFGAPSCSLFISLDALLGPVPISGGAAAFDLAIPLDPALVGALTRHQGFHLDPAANALGLVTTNYLRITIG